MTTTHSVKTTHHIILTPYHAITLTPSPSPYLYHPPSPSPYLYHPITLPHHHPITLLHYRDMKRKLQLAMALIGGSKFVLLDEPTSGMDNQSTTHDNTYILVLSSQFLSSQRTSQHAL